jgi:hypothetical protein
MQSLDILREKFSFDDLFSDRHSIYKPPSRDEALNTALSDSLLFAWSVYAENNFPSSCGYRIKNFAWDIRRLAENEDRGREFLWPLLDSWCDDADFDEVWSAADRSEVGSDALIINDLCSLHHSGNLFDLLDGDDDPLKAELCALARRFEELQGELVTEWGRAEFCEMKETVQPRNIIAFEDFWAYSPSHTYIFVPTGEMWPAATMDARLDPVQLDGLPKPMLASRFLAKFRAVDQATWAPGLPQVIEDKLISDGGWFGRTGSRTFNLYRPPTIKPQVGDASPWINHIRYIYSDEADHIIKWLAQRVQRPDQKINHALVLGGCQGIGKDSMLEPIKHAVGPWNCAEVSPQQVLGRFNSFVKSVILRISEARDLGETDRFAFYEHLKTLTAAPPDVLRCDEKHLREHSVLNVCGVVMTTNNKDALHLPADDRRHFVAWSERRKEDFNAAYWPALWKWFHGGGVEIVAHYLANLNLSDFDAKAPPPKTKAFWEIVDASRAPEDAEMADAIDARGKPDAITVSRVMTTAAPGFAEWLRDRKNRRKIGHRFEACGYVPVRNPDDARDGQWKIAGKRQTVYARRDLPVRDQIAAAQRLTMVPPPS